MRKAIGGFENVFFTCAGLLLLFSTGAAAALRPHLHLHNLRVQFGMEHLPGALLGALLFTVLVGLGRIVLSRRSGLAEIPTGYYLLFLIAVFCLYWLPALLARGFDEDDWMLLAAASIRKIIWLHPSYSWHALDAVDGNFRPLGTVLYFGYLFKFFGLSTMPYFAGLFAVDMFGSLVAFLLVRAMGYSRLAGAGASLLYMSRSMSYTIQTWPSALGDALVILLCGLMTLALLEAIRRRGPAVLGLHLMAWGCFLLATLAKQSSFAAPMIVALLLFLRPGQTELPSLPRRLLTALAGGAVYAGTAAVVFFHAKSLSREQSPYPIGFSFDALLRVFAYPTWYFGTFEFPPRIVYLRMLPSAVGAVIVLALLAVLWRVPRGFGERPRDVLFCLLAAIASISLFVVLPTRTAAYYGSMMAFWVSIALGIGLSRFGTVREGGMAARICCFAFCLLLVTGFTDIRLKQTGLFPSGGYTWGNFGSSYMRERYAELQGQLAAAPRAKVLVLVDMPGNFRYYACMALLADPWLERILVYDSTSRTYFGNDLRGARPKDEFSALNDAKSYNWLVPMDVPEAVRLTAQGPVLLLTLHNDKIVAGN